MNFHVVNPSYVLKFLSSTSRILILSPYYFNIAATTASSSTGFSEQVEKESLPPTFNTSKPL